MYSIRVITPGGHVRWFENISYDEMCERVKFILAEYNGILDALLITKVF